MLSEEPLLLRQADPNFVYFSWGNQQSIHLLFHVMTVPRECDQEELSLFFHWVSDLFVDPSLHKDTECANILRHFKHTTAQTKPTVKGQAYNFA